MKDIDKSLKKIGKEVVLLGEFVYHPKESLNVSHEYYLDWIVKTLKEMLNYVKENKINE
jgi:hypothetical protein